nr:TPA: ND4 [Bombus confusus]
MNEILVLLYLIIMVYFMDFLILSNLMFFMSFFFLMKLNWVKWNFIIGNLSLNYYSNGLILLMIWIFSLVMLNLNMYSKLCIFINMILLFLMMLNFMSMNLLMFYFMFESSLLLIFYVIMEWGYSENRVLASFYLMFYTLIFSLPMLYFIFQILNKIGNLNFLYLEMMNLKMDLFNFMYMLMSFLIKIPIYLFHGWLLKAHVEAPFFGSMILASIMLKLGSYGMLRFIFMFKWLFKNLMYMLMIINLFGMIILSILCLFQFDMKLIIAISSVIHMGIMFFSMLTMMKLSMLGGYYMMISHGLVSSGLFYLVEMIYSQSNSRIMFLNKGIMNIMPSMTMMWFILCVNNSGAPISLNMVSEIFLLMGLIYWYKYLFMFLMLYCLLSFIYSIYLFSFIQYGKSYNMNMKIYNSNLKSYLTLILHILPLNMLIFNLFV